MDGSRTAHPSAGAFPTVVALEGRTVTADWGSSELLAPFVAGRAAAGGGAQPAEVWFGAHHRHPSWVVLPEGHLPFVEVDGLEQPTFLVKVLAASAPLSIQVHPDTPTARAGFAAEEAAGIAPDAPERRFADPSGKPELLRALGPMRVLCGLRSALASRTLLTALIPSGADSLLSTLARGDAALGDVIAELLEGDASTTEQLLEATCSGAAAVIAESTGIHAPELVRLAQLALDLEARYPGDPGVLVALLLEDLDLAPGEALWVAPGTPHAYLSGVGVEVMASSDNVLRAGLTVKHVDREEFLAVLDATAVGVCRVGTLPRTADGAGWRRLILPRAAFLIDEVDLDGELAVERGGSGASVLLCLSGRVAVRGGDGSAVDLAPGGAALLVPGLDTVVVEGRGSLLHAARVSQVSPAPTSA